MICPSCGYFETGVKDSRASGDTAIRRRRLCQCGHRFTTYEIASELPPLVVARSIAMDAHAQSRMNRMAEAFAKLPFSDQKTIVDFTSRLADAAEAEALVARAREAAA